MHHFIFTKMAQKLNIRWAFNASLWQPTEQEILSASSYIQPEEKQRISRFVFQNDAKTSLIGRLMLRKFVHIATSLPYNEIKFDRDERGKPFLLNSSNIQLSFNVSHQGDYVVLAGNTGNNIGIDVMKIEPPANKDIQEFFRLMTRQFSPEEWMAIRTFRTDMEQVACFYRIWCLKESYVKNIGVGITIPLKQISFSLKTKSIKIGELVTDTVLYQNNVLKNDWVFEETLLDEKHTVAVSFKLENGSEYGPAHYTYLNFDNLVKEAKQLQETDQTFTYDFITKKLKDF